MVPPARITDRASLHKSAKIVAGFSKKTLNSDLSEILCRITRKSAPEWIKMTLIRNFLKFVVFCGGVLCDEEIFTDDFV
jgi:hypothetical protein